eukprot:symbB.v1.2.004669.t1/scaffold230.1/size260421/6
MGKPQAMLQVPKAWQASASSGGMQRPGTAQDENLVLTEALKKSEAEKEMWRRKADELEALLLSGRDRQEAPDQESLQMIEEEGCETYFLRKQLKELWVMQKTMLEKQEVMAQQLERPGPQHHSEVRDYVKLLECNPQTNNQGPLFFIAVKICQDLPLKHTILLSKRTIRPKRRSC